MRREVRSASVSECQGRRQNVEDGDGHKELPAKVHQLVIAEARKRATHPDIEQKEKQNLDDKPEDGKDRPNDCAVEDCDVVEDVSELRVGAAEKEQSGDARDGDHVRVLS